MGKVGAWVARIRMPSSASTAAQRRVPVCIVTEGYLLDAMRNQKRGRLVPPPITPAERLMSFLSSFPPFDPVAMTRARACVRPGMPWPHIDITALKPLNASMPQTPCRLLDSEPVR